MANGGLYFRGILRRPAFNAPSCAERERLKSEYMTGCRNHTFKNIKTRLFLKLGDFILNKGFGHLKRKHLKL